MCGTEPGSAETYAEQVAMPLGGKVRMIDRCIHHIVASLNAGGVETVACCCGHNKQHGIISLADGRALLVMSHKDAMALMRPTPPNPSGGNDPRPIRADHHSPRDRASPGAAPGGGGGATRNTPQ